MTDDTWGQSANDLLKRIGKNNFVTWIEPLRLSGIETGVARFEVPTVFFGDWVSRNYADQIRTRLNRRASTVDRVEFAVAPRTARMAPHVPRSAAAAKPQRARAGG